MLIDQKNIYTGRVISLNLEQVKLPNGVECELEIIHHPGGVAIVAVNDKQQMCLLRQYRHAAQGWLWEIPAGKREKNEQGQRTAQRELQEEAGMHAQQWDFLGKSISSPGVFTEEIELYLATDLQQGNFSLEAEEVIEVHWFTLEAIQQMVLDGEVYDGKTLIGLYFYQQYMQRKKQHGG